MVENVHALTARSGTWQDTTNWWTSFWANYFEVGTVTKAYRAIDNYTAVRLRRWLYGSIKISARARRHSGYSGAHYRSARALKSAS